MLTAPEVEFATAYRSRYGITTVVLQEGSKVIHMSFTQHGSGEKFPLEYWADTYAGYLKKAR